MLRSRWCVLFSNSAAVARKRDVGMEVRGGLRLNFSAWGKFQVQNYKRCMVVC